MYKKDKITNLIITILVSLVISIVVFKFLTKDKIIVTQTQTVTINSEIKEKLDINKCTKEDLKQLPGIGEKTAELIIKNRPYASINDLLKIDGIGDKVLKNIEGRIKVQ